MVRRMMAVILVSICIFGWNLAYAQEGKSNNAGFSGRPDMPGHPQNHPPRPMNAGDMIGKALHDQMALEVLAELTGKSVTAAEITGEKLHDILQSSGIQPDAFKTAMDAKSTVLLQKAVSCGLITDVQASDMIQQMQRAPQQGSPITGK